MPDTINTLIHEGVLIADQNQLRFFHDEYFDFIFARQHLASGGTADNLVRGGRQDLPIRGQVRAVLSLERQSDAPNYVHDLRILLDPRVARSHVRAAVLTWLSGQASILDDELQAVLEIAENTQDPLQWQAMRALCSQPFIETINRHGLLAMAANVLGGRWPDDGDESAEPVRQLGQQGCEYLLSEAARYQPEAAAAALLPLTSDPDIAARFLRVVLQSVFLAGPTAGPTTVRLFCAAIESVVSRALSPQADTCQDAQPADAEPYLHNAISGLYGEHGLGILALTTLAKRPSAPAVEAVSTWLTAAARLAAAHGAAHVFDKASPLPRGKTGLDIFEACATRQPVAFAEALTPFLIEQLQLAAFPHARWRPIGQPKDTEEGFRYDILGVGSFGHSLDDEIFQALRTALRRSAAEDPDHAAPVIALLTATDLLTAQQLAATALSSCAIPLLPAALAWASQPQVRGLDSGPTTAWAWGEVLAHIADTGDEEQRNAVFKLVIDPYRAMQVNSLRPGDTGQQPTSDEQYHPADEATKLAAEQLIALSLITRRLKDRTVLMLRERLVQLEENLGPAPSTPTPDMIFRPRRSPIPDSEAASYTDSDWVAAMHTYAHATDDNSNEWPEGGVHQVAAQLETAAKAEPIRFARLVAEIGPDAHPVYVTTLIHAMTGVAQEVSDDDVADLLNMARTVWAWSSPQFNQALCRLIAALTDRPLPDDIIDIVAAIAATATANGDQTMLAGDDLIVAGLSCDQGQAVYTMAHLLAPQEPRHPRVLRLLPSLETVVRDPAEHVHVLLPSVIFRISLADFDAGVDLATQWLADANDGELRAPDLDRLTWQLLLGKSNVGLKLIQRMLNSNIPETRTKGGLLATLADLRQIELSDDNGMRPATSVLLRSALSDDAARKGVAILLAERIDELPEPITYGTAPPDPQHADRGMLVRLLNDPDSQVRESAMRFGHDLTSPLEMSADLLAATACSRAFAEHPEQMLYALRRRSGEAPVDECLEICEHWLTRHATSAGDLRTAAAGHAYHVVDIALAIHARTAVNSSQRERCLTLLDRLIESGAADADRKADDPTSYWED